MEIISAKAVMCNKSVEERNISIETSSKFIMNKNRSGYRVH